MHKKTVTFYSVLIFPVLPYKRLVKWGAFTVSIAYAAHIEEADYFGVESGNKVTERVGEAFRDGLKLKK